LDRLLQPRGEEFTHLSSSSSSSGSSNSSNDKNSKNSKNNSLLSKIFGTTTTTTTTATGGSSSVLSPLQGASLFGGENKCSRCYFIRDVVNWNKIYVSYTLVLS
tara:strand:+ start:825 stop:1136 length:312 start_codon:yes stop_codon:yes gene_type:complete